MPYEGQFDAIKEVHEDGMKHGCQDFRNKKLQKMQANIIFKQMHAVADCCEVCQVKKGDTGCQCMYLIGYIQQVSVQK